MHSNHMKSLSFFVVTLMLTFVWTSGCDDGGTSNEVRFICGDGKVDPSEECDSGQLVGRTCETFGYRGGTLNCTQQCTYDFSGCVSKTCGDGVTDTNEECDEGQDNSDEPNASCRTTCHLPSCGDGVVDDLLGEECDDGTANSDDPNAGCRSDCTLPGCGDGVVDDVLGEVCDDGGTDSGDGCSADCRSTEVCGNGYVDVDEECDDGTANSDDPNACRPDCTLPGCGDGVVDDVLGEVCDDGGTDSGDGCSADCRSTEVCGNGYVDVDEECDDGTANSDDPNACRPDCHLPACGDGIVDTLFGEQCEDGNTIDLDGCHHCRITEFQVSTVATRQWQYPDVAMAPDGRFTVVWTRGDNMLTDDIYAQSYDASAMRTGPEFRVNTYTVNAQFVPAIAMASDGRFVVVWENKVNSELDYDVQGQRYNADGTPDGTEFRVNSYTPNEQRDPDVAMASDGRFVVVWSSYDQEGSRREVYGQRFEADGTPDGTEFRVNSYTESDQWRAHVAMADDGRFVVVWESYGQDGDVEGIFAQRFGADGSRDGTEFQVNTYTAGTQRLASVAMADDGRFVVVWESYGQDGDSYGIYGQRFGADGSRDGSEFQVNTHTTGIQVSSDVAMADDGRFVVVWTSYEQDAPGGTGVFGQRFGADGSRDGTEFQVNSQSINNQEVPAVYMNPDGSFIVVWLSNANAVDAAQYDVMAQRYSPDGTPMGVLPMQ